MKKFKFKLEKVLDYRRQEKGVIQEELAQIQKEFSEAEDKLNELLSNKKELQLKLKEKEKHDIDLQQAMSHRDYLEVLKVKIEEQRKIVNQLQRELNECRQKLLEKRKECKTLSKLKEKQFADYRREFLKKEQEKIDELATNNFNQQTDEVGVVI